MKVEKSEKFNGVCDGVVGCVNVIKWKSVTIKKHSPMYARDRALINI